MITAGIVGVGGWGKALVRSVRGSDRIRFARGVTRTPSKAEAFGREYGLPIDDDFDALLADPAIDAVVLATPHSQHLSQIALAAAAGKHIYVEKPLALDGASAAEACRLAGAAGVVLALGHNRRQLPAWKRLRALVDEGALGDLLYVEGNFSGPSAYRQSREGWRADTSESPAGGMTGKGIHLTDLMIALFGPVHSVLAQSDRQVLSFGMDDTTRMLMRFASGQSGSLATLTATPVEWRLQVFGSKGWAEIRDEHTLRLRRIDGPDVEERFGAFDIERASLEHFADTVENGASWPVTAAQAIANTALLESIAASIRTGAAVTIPSHDAAGDQA